MTNEIFKEPNLLMGYKNNIDLTILKNTKRLTGTLYYVADNVFTASTFFKGSSQQIIPRIILGEGKHIGGQPYADYSKWGDSSFFVSSVLSDEPLLLGFVPIPNFNEIKKILISDYKMHPIKDIYINDEKIEIFNLYNDVRLQNSFKK